MIDFWEGGSEGWEVGSYPCLDERLVDLSQEFSITGWLVGNGGEVESKRAVKLNVDETGGYYSTS